MLAITMESLLMKIFVIIINYKIDVYKNHNAFGDQRQMSYWLNQEERHGCKATIMQ